MDEERREDLNPQAGDIEEKVKRMLDPSMPDEPATTSKPASKPVKPIKIQAVSTPAADSTPSAPELPTEAVSASKSPKVVIPISHDDDHNVSVTEDKPATKAKPTEPETAPPVTKITIADHNDSTAEVAEKLDEAIAELEPAKLATKAKAARKKSTPPPAPEPEPEIEIEPEVETPESDAADIELQPVETAELDIPIDDPAVIVDPATDKAVDDIVAAESDEILEIEDAVRDTDEPVEPAKPTPKSRRKLGTGLKRLFASKAFRRTVVVLLLVAATAVAAYPPTRYFALNTARVRASSSVTIVDDSTNQPLKNAQVTVAGVQATTDANGVAELHGVKLGPSSLIVHKRAYADVSKQVTIGWGSNPLGNLTLTPTGTQYSFTTVDFLSGKPMAGVEASSGDANAKSDDKGLIKLNVDQSEADKDTLTVSLKLEGKRTENMTINTSDKAVHSVKLVTERKQTYITKRSGHYDIYSIYIDGQDDKLVLAGSGTERADMVLVPHPTANVAAYVSTRANQHNSDGYLLSNLLIINLDDNSTTNVGASERIQVIDWSGERLIYVQIAAGASGNDPKRYRLMSYDYVEHKAKELASSNFFNDVVYAGGAIYYAPSSAFQTGQTNFSSIKSDGGSPQTLYNQEVWNIFRTAYDHLTLSVQQQWYDYRIGDKTPTKLNAAPANQISRVYVDSADGKHSLWVDQRDGKGVVLLYDTTTKIDKQLISQSGITYPLHWLSNDVVVYRVKTPTETADYVLSLDGGNPVKIKDVTNSGG
jgi:hypothetical protein